MDTLPQLCAPTTCPSSGFATKISACFKCYHQSHLSLRLLARGIRLTAGTTDIKGESPLSSITSGSGLATPHVSVGHVNLQDPWAGVPWSVGEPKTVDVISSGLIRTTLALGR